jgi:hypothetical protein
MTKYTVHLWVTVRVPVEVEAGSMAAACAEADDMVEREAGRLDDMRRLSRPFVWDSPAEGAIVDIEGDEAFVLSRRLKINDAGDWVQS